MSCRMSFELTAFFIPPGHRSRPTCVQSCCFSEIIKHLPIIHPKQPVQHILLIFLVERPFLQAYIRNRKEPDLLLFPFFLLYVITKGNTCQRFLFTVLDLSFYFHHTFPLQNLNLFPDDRNRRLTSLCRMNNHD